jgi:hypothetical protein
MPRCGATFNENHVPPCTRGDFRVFGNGNPPTPVLRATPPMEGIFQRITHIAWHGVMSF